MRIDPSYYALIYMPHVRVYFVSLYTNMPKNEMMSPMQCPADDLMYVFSRDNRPSQVLQNSVFETTSQ